MYAILKGIPVKPVTAVSNEQREGVVSTLNTLLSDEYLLYTKARKYHWNVSGPQSNDLHKLLAGHYEQLEELVDDIAQQTRSLGGSALGTMTEFMKHTRLQEQPGEQPDARHILRNLLADHESLVRLLRGDRETCNEKFPDLAANDFLTGILDRHERMTWMFRAFLRAFFEDEAE
jgi:starvation-inducible DNA-binding protein